MYQEGALHLNRERRTDPWRSFQTEAKYVSRQDRNRHSFRTTAFFFTRSDLVLPRSKTQQYQFTGSHDPFYLFLFLFLIASPRYLVVTVPDDMEEENCFHVARCKDSTLDSPPTKGTPYSRVSNVMPTSSAWLLSPIVFDIPSSYSMIMILNWEVLIGNAMREYALLPLIYAFIFSNWRFIE